MGSTIVGNVTFEITDVLFPVLNILFENRRKGNRKDALLCNSNRLRGIEWNWL